MKTIPKENEEFTEFDKSMLRSVGIAPVVVFSELYLPPPFHAAILAVIEKGLAVVTNDAGGNA